MAFNILHLLEDPRKAVRRACELMKPGGLLVSSTPCLGEAGLVLRSMVPLISKVIGLSYMKTFRVPEVNDLMRNGELRILESEVRRTGSPFVSSSPGRAPASRISPARQGFPAEVPARNRHRRIAWGLHSIRAIGV